VTHSTGFVCPFQVNATKPHEQAVGHNEEADRLLIQAQEIDPEAVADVLREHDAARAPDARLQSTADQDVERVLPRIKPGPEQSSGCSEE
jgi:hypothetical protein